MGRRAVVYALALILAASTASSLDDASHERVPMEQLSSSLEQGLIWTLLDVQAGRLEDALMHVSRLVEERPDFELAQLVRGDVLSALASPLGGFGAPSGTTDRLDGLREEAKARLLRFVAGPPSLAVPADLVQIPPGAKHAILVDTRSFRLYVFAVENGALRRLFDFYVSIGKGGDEKRSEGDEKTPLGLYRVASYLPGESLPDMYGRGAFPIDYPNEWDRLQGRTGGGIWIHGTEPDRYSRPPLSSLGCVTLSNEDFLRLRDAVEVGATPVVLSRGIRWVSPDSVEAVRQSVGAAIETWRRDWESRDVDRYLSHYSSSFRTAGMNRAAFAAHKRRVNASKSFIKVDLGDIGVYGYPGEPAMVTVEFRQDYRSDSFKASKHKRQYWRLEEGAWRIVFET
jgi:murein L,D-transpeptidase YafK